MKKIGITGGIGSGKSLVCQIYATLGIPVYHADLRARHIIAKDPRVRNLIIKEFGKSAFAGAKYNSRFIADIVFNSPVKLNKLNQIVHPAVFKDFQYFSEQFSKAPYLLHEAAILFESNSDKMMDYNILVDAPVEIRIKRTMLRDNITKEDVKKRMKNQWPADKIRPLADFIIINDDNELLLPQVLDIHKKILEL